MVKEKILNLAASVEHFDKDSLNPNDSRKANLEDSKKAFLKYNLQGKSQPIVDKQDGNNIITSLSDQQFSN